MNFAIHAPNGRRMVLSSVLLVGLWLLSAAIPTAAQYNLIAAFSDTTHTNCGVTYSCFGEGENEDCGYILFWVFHYSTAGAQASRFKAPYQSCFTEHGWVGDYRPFPGAIGNTQVGITIPYGSCRSGWTHILTVWYYSGSHIGAGPCCEYPISPHPEASTGQVEVLDCTGTWISADNAAAFVNPGPSCPCSIPTGIANGVTTWGAVKALYNGE
jgi:hypothetical protein